MDSTAIAKEDEEFAGFLSDRPEFQRGISSTPGQHGPVGSIKSKVEVLHQHLAGIQEQEAKAKVLSQQSKSLMGETREAMSSREEAAQELALQLDVAEACSKELVEEERELGQMEKSCNEAMTKVQSAIKTYSTALGLQFRAKGNFLLIVFTLIDASEPNREFRIGLNIQSDGLYNVCFCDPPVGEFDNLKCKLVVNEDFKDFLVAMRHEFRKLVETGR